MLIKSRLFEHYNNYNFKIPLEGGERVYIKDKDSVKPGDLLFVKSDNRIKESHFLVDQLGCKPAECPKYITCINGSYIESGEVLAEKTSSKGLTVKKIISKEAGIVDLDRIEKGFIDILAEEEEVGVESKFSGVIKEVLPGSYIEVKSPASALDLAATTIFNQKIFGDIVFLNKGNNLISEIPEIDLKNKIVWLGSYLPISLALKAFERGASAIVAYSMEYEDFKSVNLPIGIMEGFGKIHCDEKFLNELYKIDENFIVLDNEENQLFIAKKEQREQNNSEFFVKELLGAQVISRHSSHYGYIGTIVQINDLNYVTVDFDNSGKSIVDLGSLDFITM